jgi:thiamine biosynthesis protein ThiS
MKIILNCREEEFDREKMSVSERLMLKKFSYRLRIIKINNLLIAKDKYDSAFIQDGDRVEMLYLMSGG